MFIKQTCIVNTTKVYLTWQEWFFFFFWKRTRWNVATDEEWLFCSRKNVFHDPLRKSTWFVAYKRYFSLPTVRVELIKVQLCLTGKTCSSSVQFHVSESSLLRPRSRGIRNRSGFHPKQNKLSNSILSFLTIFFIHKWWIIRFFFFQSKPWSWGSRTYRALLSWSNPWPIVKTGYRSWDVHAKTRRWGRESSALVPILFEDLWWFL